MPANHPLFNSVYRLPTHPPLKMVSNGARILMLYSPTDISHHWQGAASQSPQTGKPAYQLGVNMFVYAAGRRDLKNRLDSNNLAAATGASSMTVKVARVKYAGNWDPEPYAWTRFGRWFHKQTGYRPGQCKPIDMRNPRCSIYPSLSPHPDGHRASTARHPPMKWPPSGNMSTTAASCWSI